MPGSVLVPGRNIVGGVHGHVWGLENPANLRILDWKLELGGGRGESEKKEGRPRRSQTTNQDAEDSMPLLFFSP